jgi:hypothetical protein
MRFAYADPPYINQARKHYAHDPNCAEVDHAALARELETFDGFALSCKSDAKELAWLISLFTKPVRLGMWFKPFCSFKPNVGVAYAFEPVIWWSSRRRERTQQTVRDWIEAPAVRANITLQKGLSGVKPDKFSYWLFEVLNMQTGDEFVDMFPGSGAVTSAWEMFIARDMPTQTSLMLDGSRA